MGCTVLYRVKLCCSLSMGYRSVRALHSHLGEYHRAAPRSAGTALTSVSAELISLSARTLRHNDPAAAAAATAGHALPLSQPGFALETLSQAHEPWDVASNGNSYATQVTLA